MRLLDDFGLESTLNDRLGVVHPQSKARLRPFSSVSALTNHLISSPLPFFLAPVIVIELQICHSNSSVRGDQSVDVCLWNSACPGYWVADFSELRSSRLQ
jgi:hypothetical protein